jgi:hypothetical protein
MAAVLAVIVVAAGAGVAVERRDPARTRAAIGRALDVLLWVVSPFITFFVVARFELTTGAGVGILFAYLAAAVAGAAGYLLATRVLHLRPAQAGAVTVTVMFANSGYLGIPLTAALLGREAIAPAVVFDTLVSAIVLYVGAFAVGAALGTRAGESRRERVKAYLTRNPVLLALVAAFLAPDALAPDVLVAVAAVVKLGLAPAVVLACSVLLVEVPKAYLVESAMPSGINSLLVAHAFGLDLRLTAAIVAWTHVLVILAAPVAALLL